jgi:general secretion pathway protein G
MLRTKNANRRGFTLIELLVVILILAILAALIVPRMIGQTDNAKRAKAVTDIKTLNDAMQRFRLECDRFPTDEEGLMALRNNPGDTPGWNGPYLDRDPAPDPWGNEYVYQNLGNNEILIESYGADGVEGGDGNNADLSNRDDTGQ